MAPASSPFIETALKHRTIREYEDRRVPEETLNTLIEVARQTATSSGMQLSSLIIVDDPEKRHQIVEVAKQDYIARAPHLWIFIVDCARAHQLISENGADAGGMTTMDVFFQGFTDAILQAQNVNSAAESLGLGTCFLGSPLNDPFRLAEILELPPLTFPALGLMFGYPAQEPQLKPRMSMKLRTFTDRYQRIESQRDAIASYDAQMLKYYDTRDTNQKSSTFTEQLTKRAAVVLPKRRKFLEAMRQQGFNLGIQD